MTARNERSEFVANRQLNRQLSEVNRFNYVCDCTKMSVKSGNLAVVINNGFNCLNEQFWAIPANVSKNVSRGTIKSRIRKSQSDKVFSSANKMSWKQKLCFAVNCMKVVDKFWV